MLRRAAVVAVLLIPSYWYVRIPLEWDARQLAHVTGDEPHYLIAADAIARDHSLKVKAAYARDEAAPIIYGSIDWQNHTRVSTAGTFSIHGVGLPALIAPAWAVSGLTGVRLFLALLTSLFPFVFYAIARRVGLSRIWAIGLSLCTAIGLPFMDASGQVMPDLPTGLVLMGLSVALMAGTTDTTGTTGTTGTGGASNRTWLVAGLLAAVLPWLHIKNILPMVPFVVGFLTADWRTDRDGRRNRAALLVVPVITSIVLLGFYNVTAFGHVTGPYSATDAGATMRQAGMIALGLHLDQAQGLFIQQPLFLLALAGVPLFMRRMPRVGWTMAAAYLALIAANSLHPCWYGCASFSGRFMWSVAAFWFVPLAVLVSELAPVERRVASVLGGLALAWQVALMSGWRADPQALYRRMFESLADRNSLFALEWRRFFPSFYDFDRYLHRPINLVGIALVLMVLGAGVWLQTRRGTKAGLRRVLVPVLVPIIFVVVIGWIVHARTAVSIDLLDHLATAELMPRSTSADRFVVAERRIGEETRHALATPAPSRVTWTIPIPADACLEVWIGRDQADPSEDDKGVTFGIALGDGQQPSEWKTWTITREQGSGRWMPLRLDLAPFGGRVATVSFQTEPIRDGETSSATVYWASPRIRTY